MRNADGVYSLERIRLWRGLPWLGTAIVLGLAAWWRVANLNAIGPFHDEGTYLMWAKHVAQGHPLYSETRAVQGPLFLSAIAAGFRLVGISAATGRWVTIIFGLLALPFLAGLSRPLAGWPAALAGMTLLSITPAFFAYSRSALGDIQAVSVALLAVLMADRYRRGARYGSLWLAGSGFVLALSYLIKALHPLLPLLVAWLILRRRLGWPVRLSNLRPALRPVLNDGAWFALGLILPLALAFVIWDAPGLFDALVTFRLELRAAHTFDIGQNLAKIGEFVWSNHALAALGGLGLAWLLKRRPAEATWLAVWLGLTVITLFLHTPLFPHHLLTLLPPLAILAGLGLVWSVTGVGAWRAAPGGDRILTALGLALIAGYLGALPGIVAANNANRRLATGGREAEAIAFLQEITRPTDFLISDNLMLVFLAERQTPPPLGDVAQVAINAGRQTSENLIALSEAYDVPAVASWSLRLPWLAEYEAWLEENYLARRVWDNHHVIYFGRRWPEGVAPPNERSARLGRDLLWRGYRLDTGSPHPGQSLPVTLFWQAQATPPVDYTVFVQVLDADGRRVAGWDSQPLHGYLPTSAWQPGQIIPDRMDVPLPEDLPPGVYTLITGMYDPETLERLPVA
ncbi:MAG: ArnT family glycosyltransferase, partial [Anaerolineae bacterium]